MARDPAAVAVSEAMAVDDELGSAARVLAATAIQAAQQFLEYGSPQVKLRIVITLLPAVGRALAGQGEDEEMGELRAQLRELQRSMLDAS
jgi:hypothetical protein